MKIIRSIFYLKQSHFVLSMFKRKNNNIKQKEAAIRTHRRLICSPYANNKGADQPAHPRSLISAIVVHCQNRMIPLLYVSEISRF